MFNVYSVNLTIPNHGHRFEGGFRFRRDAVRAGQELARLGFGYFIEFEAL